MTCSELSSSSETFALLTESRDELLRATSAGSTSSAELFIYGKVSSCGIGAGEVEGEGDAIKLDLTGEAEGLVNGELGGRLSLMIASDDCAKSIIRGLCV